MTYSFYELAFLFFGYSFLGWLLETVVATVKGKSFANRGFISGPFCVIYGLAGIVLAVMLGELKSSLGFLFLGSALIATALEWICAKLLERLGRRKWWDYSSKRFNLDGYICLSYSLLWGVLGCGAMYFGNDALTALFHLLPAILGKVLIWVLIPLTALDGVLSLMTVFRWEHRPAWMVALARRMRSFTLRFGGRVASHVDRRLEKAYPAKQREKTEEKADGEKPITLSKLFWMFVIGAFLGDIVETLFCRATAGVWMSRSSLVWGPFSVVWGLALALATALLHRDRDKSSTVIFLTGTLLGGVYEYVCSVFTELVFGAVFWDYSHMPFNLGGRINLLYCFFWGIAAVAWIKGVYPWFSRLVEWVQKKTGRVVTILLAVFMVVNVFVSISALVRYDQRGQGLPAENGWEELIDARFDDERMERIYPNSLRVD